MNYKRNSIEESNDFYFEVVFYKDVVKSKEYVKEIYNKFLKKYGYSKNDVTWKLTSNGIGFSSSSENIGFDLEDYILDHMYEYGDYEFETDYELMESKTSARKSLKESKIMSYDEFKKIVKKEFTKDEIESFGKTDNSYGVYVIAYGEKEIETMCDDLRQYGFECKWWHSSDPEDDEPIYFIEAIPIMNESKKSARKSIKESKTSSILDDEFYDLIKQGYIYDEDENGMNMSYGEYVAVSDDLWETLENELEYYRDFPSAYDAYNEIMDNTSDDAKMFMGVSDDDYFYFEINEDENTYSFSGEVPTVLEKLFKKFLKETDFERV